MHFLLFIAVVWYNKNSISCPGNSMKEIKNAKKNFNDINSVFLLYRLEQQPGTEHAGMYGG